MRTTWLVAFVTLALFFACSNSAPDPALDKAARDDRAVRLGQVVATGAGVPGSADAMSALSAHAPNAPVPSAERRAPRSDFSSDSVSPTMLIRSGTASIEVDSLEPGIARVRELARHVGGYVANTSLQAGRNQTHAATLEIRLPASRYDEALSGLKPIGRVESVNVSAEDVGEEFVDVTARVANAHRLELRLIDVLATKTGKLKDVLDVERELGRVREDVERMEGRLRYLRTRVSVSTLVIAVHEPYPVVGERGSSGVLGAAFKQSWRNFVTFIARCIAALGTLIPALVLLLGAAAVAVALWRRYGPTRRPI
jgi:Domain of unknown function (DUF4349)